MSSPKTESKAESRAESPPPAQKPPPKRSSSPSSRIVNINTAIPEDFYSAPDFIYGGPFIAVKKPSPFVDAITPINLPLQGTFKQYVILLYLELLMTLFGYSLTVTYLA